MACSGGSYNELLLCCRPIAEIPGGTARMLATEQDPPETPASTRVLRFAAPRANMSCVSWRSGRQECPTVLRAGSRTE